MRSIWRVVSLVGHLLAAVAAVLAALAATAHLAYPPLRLALVALVAVLAAVTLFGRFPLGLGPAAGSAPALIVRTVGATFAGIGAVGVILGFGQGSSPSERASTAVPLYMVILAVNLAATLAVTSRGSVLRPRATLIGVGLGLLAAALFAAAVPVLPPGLIGLAFLLVAAAAVGAGRLTEPVESRVLGALLATATACQGLFFAAAALYHFGPDSWMPYAGPGPLTPQAQLEQNRAEALDPYVGLLLLGAVSATVLVTMALTARSFATAPGRGSVGQPVAPMS